MGADVHYLFKYWNFDWEQETGSKGHRFLKMVFPYFSDQFNQIPQQTGNIKNKAKIVLWHEEVGFYNRNGESCEGKVWWITLRA